MLHRRGHLDTLFTPRDLSPTLWLDATDANTILDALGNPVASGNVAQWLDKSGNELHVTQSDDALRPATNVNTINGLNTLDFTGDIMETSVSPFGASISDALVMSIHRIDSIVTGTYFTLTGVAALDNRWQAHVPWSNGLVIFDVGGSVAGYRISAYYGIEAEVILNGFYSSVVDGVQQIYKNGVVLVESDTPHSVPTTGLGIKIGGIGATLQDTSIGEFIVINNTVSTENIKKLEGYLAHKWFFAHNLPAGHPYKNRAPRR